VTQARVERFEIGVDVGQQRDQQQGLRKRDEIPTMVAEVPGSAFSAVTRFDVRQCDPAGNLVDSIAEWVWQPVFIHAGTRRPDVQAHPDSHRWLEGGAQGDHRRHRACQGTRAPASSDITLWKRSPAVSIGRGQRPAVAIKQLQERMAKQGQQYLAEIDEACKAAALRASR
jgi:hypothetical protein